MRWFLLAATLFVSPAFGQTAGTPPATTLAGGTVFAGTCSTSQWLEAITSGTGALVCAQPNYSDLAGSVPFAGASTSGGVLASTAPANQFATGFNTSGVAQYAQPSVLPVNAGKPSSTVAAGAINTDTNGLRLCASTSSGTWYCGNGPTFVSTGSVATGNSITTEQNMASIAIPANAIGLNGHIRVRYLYSALPGDTNSKTFSLRYSSLSCAPGATCTNGTLYMNVTSAVATTEGLRGDTEIIELNSTASQVGSTNANVGAYGFGINTNSPITSTVPATATSYVNIDCTVAVPATDTCTLYGYTVEILPGS